MKVSITDFDVDMQIKNKGVTMAVYSPDGKTYLGKVNITKTGLEWFEGKKQTGKKVKWEKFIEMMS